MSNRDSCTHPPRTQPPQEREMSERYETEDIVDNGAIVRTDITPINNHTGHGILISPYPRFGTSNYFTVRISIEEYNRTKHLQATILHHRYWHDFAGQPRRNPTMRPLLQNGRAYRR